MSDMPLDILLASGFLLFVALVVTPFAKWMADQKEVQFKMLGEFYPLATSLAADERVPSDFAAILQAISEDFNKPAAVYRVFLSWLRGTLGPRILSDEQAKFRSAVQDLPDDIRPRMRRAFALGLLSVTYAAPIRGAILRRLLLFPIGLPERPDEAPSYVYELECRSRSGVIPRAA